MRFATESSYVPILLAGMACPIEFSNSVRLGPDFRILQRLSYEREGEHAKVSVVRVRGMGRLLSRSEVVRVAKRSRLKVDRANASTEQLNQRIRSVLNHAAGLDYGEDSKRWWTAWKDYNELEYPEKYPEEKPVYETTYYTSCFAADTGVWTLTGEVPIKQIKLGDRVLCQDPETGELAFKPVLTVTTRSPSRMIKVNLGSETITATRGHPFWVNGQGWRMAKQLQLGQHLHSASGAVPIERLTETDPAKPWYEVSYNLVVADFNTYFVGKHQVLVHDNTTQQPTFALVPGLPATRLTHAAAARQVDSAPKGE